jgi:hypothetical protein
MNAKVVRHVTVRILIELTVATVAPPLSTKGGQLAMDVRSHATKSGYVKTADGWFVPIQDLLPRVDDVAEFLHFEMLQCNGEFEIAGGFEILTGEGKSLGISQSSNFRFAMDLADTIINLHQENEGYEVFANNQDVWKLSLNNGKIKIRIDQIARHKPREFWLPAEELKQHLEAARVEVEHFAAKLEPLLLAYRDIPVTSETIRWMFGLDKLSG